MHFASNVWGLTLSAYITNGFCLCMTTLRRDSHKINTASMHRIDRDTYSCSFSLAVIANCSLESSNNAYLQRDRKNKLPYSRKFSWGATFHIFQGQSNVNTTTHKHFFWGLSSQIVKISCYTVLSRAYKRREGMQQQMSRVQTWADECAWNAKISIFSKCTHSSAHIWTLLATCTDSGVACPLFFYTPLVLYSNNNLSVPLWLSVSSVLVELDVLHLSQAGFSHRYYQVQVRGPLKRRQTN